MKLWYYYGSNGTVTVQWSEHFSEKCKKKINKNKKMQVYQQFDVDIVPACNFI